MLQVEDYERFRKAVSIEGMTQREASRELRHSRGILGTQYAFTAPPATIVLNYFAKTICCSLIIRKASGTGSDFQQKI